MFHSVGLRISGSKKTGFYRVKYDDELAARLVNAIKAKKLSLMDKIGKDPSNLALLFTF